MEFMDADEVVLQADENMNKAVGHAMHEFSTIHTGKATPTMVETIAVEAYGVTMQLKEVAAITTPDARTITVEPWDKSVLRDVERAVRGANLGFNPIVRGNSLFCPLPELSGERRRALVKVTHGMAEQGKVAVRAGRREAMDRLKQIEKDKGISEDDLKRYEKDVQIMTDDYIKDIEKHLKFKEEELTSV